jgi:AraC family transcriptional regulator of adaptative response/methylated-DNA-[protein]-cysteine methyltransferase
MASPIHLAAIQRTCDLIATSETLPSLGQLSAMAGFSRFHFHRLFKSFLGITPREYAATCRLMRLQQELARGTPVLQAIYEAGYGSPSRVYERAANMLGMTPSCFRAGARGTTICHVDLLTPFGWLLVALTSRGLCALEFGESPAELRTQLSGRFPRASIHEGSAELRALISKTAGVIALHGCCPELQRSIQEVAYQRRLWRALWQILFAAPRLSGGQS